MERFIQANSGEREILLTEILKSEDELFLNCLARDTRCWEWFRCAAIDRYMRAFIQNAELLLKDLAKKEKEPNKDVRKKAIQWLSWLSAYHSEKQKYSNGIAVTRGPRSKIDWRKMAADDPSPDIQFLSLLGK